MFDAIFVSGGSKGIGESIVRRFAADGKRVAFTYLSSESNARSLAEETGACAIPMDASDSRSVKIAVNTAKDLIGDIDVLVNNAGISQIKLFSDITDADWDYIMSINAKGPFNTIRALLPGMISKKRGRIINIASVWGVVGASCEAHYSASKSAVIALSRALAKEVAPSDITVNCVAPGAIDTAMNAHLSDEERAELCGEIPLSRMGMPCEVAELVAFLASKSAGYITGQTICIDGGLTL